YLSRPLGIDIAPRCCGVIVTCAAPLAAASWPAVRVVPLRPYLVRRNFDGFADDALHPGIRSIDGIQRRAAADALAARKLCIGQAAQLKLVENPCPSGSRTYRNVRSRGGFFRGI